MRKFFKMISFFALAMSIASCAVKEELTADEKEVAALDAWVKQNMPELEEVEEGLYLKVYKADPDAKTITYSSSDYVWYTYSCQTLSGDYYYNMDPDISYQLGYFDHATHYAPEVSSIEDMDSSVNSAIIYAIGVSNPGDSVVLVGSSKYMYSGLPISELSGRPAGFGGNTALAKNNPGILKLKFDGYTKNIKEYNREQVQDYATNKMKKLLSDSIADVSLMYLDKLVEFPEADTIPADSIVKVYYTGRFLDGFVFDTNIEEVARENNIYNSDKPYIALSLTSASESYVEGFRKAIKNMNIGETVEAVFTSSLGYDDELKSEGATWIQPGTPLVFTIKVLGPDEKE